MDTASLTVSLGAGVLAIGIIAWASVKISRSLARERTRRELFAYVAESSLTMEQAERLIALCEQCDMRREVLAVAHQDWDWDRWRATVTAVVDKPDAPTPTPKPAS
jgi:hypothetical protein